MAMPLAAMPSVAMELNGRPLVVKNTFIDVDEVVSQGSAHKRNSAPGSLMAASYFPDRSPRDEPLGQLRLRLLSTYDELDSDPCRGKAGNVNVLETASTAASFDSALHPSLVVPQVFNGGPNQYSSWTAVNSSGHLGNAQGGKTTLMFRNLPEGFTRSKLEELLQIEGFACRYNFLYLPAELSSGVCFGYALINMVTASDAECFIQHFQGFCKWPVACDKRAVVHMSEELQGLSEMTERYRNSPLMHPSVADSLRPAMYSNGSRVWFPKPTVSLKPPRARKANRKRTAGK